MPDCPWSLKDALKVFFVYVILMFIGLPMIVQLFQVVTGYNLRDSSIGIRGTILIVSLLIGISMCLYIFYLVRYVYHRSFTALGLTTANVFSHIVLGIKRYLITLPFIVIAGYVVNLISHYYGVSPDMQDVVKWVLDEKSPFLLFFLLFFGTVMAPCIEEIIFRGFLQSALKKSFGGRYAIIISAFLFAFVHMDLFASLQIFILGLLLGFLYEKTKTLAASIFVHILHNSLTVILLLYFKYFLNGKAPIF